MQMPAPVLYDFDGAHSHDEQVLRPLVDFQREFRAALAEAGYDTPDKIIDLVRQVKRELAAEARRPVQP
jgi:hypothetical protein